MILQPHKERTSSWVIALMLSSALHAGAVIYAFGLVPFQLTPPPVPSSFPEINIRTAALPQETPIATPDVETPDPVDPTTAEALQPENLTPVEADTLTPEDGEKLAGVDAQTVTEVDGEELTGADVEEDLISGLIPDDTEAAIDTQETVEAIIPENLSPILADDTTVLQGATTAPRLPESVPDRIAAVDPSSIERAVRPAQGIRVAPLNTVPERGRATPAAQPAAPQEPPTPEELALLEIIERIRQRLGDRCLIALPQSGTTSTPSIVLVSDQDRTMATFQREVLSDPDLPVEVTNILVDTRQCPAVEFARGRAAYPQFRVNLQLRDRNIASGEQLIGNIGGVGGRYTSLMLIDDNGVVQDLRRFTRFVGSAAEFDIPVNRDGASRDTSQLLLVMTTAGRPETLTNLAGRLAEDFFGPLEEELGTRGQIAILPFYVR